MRKQLKLRFSQLFSFALLLVLFFYWVNNEDKPSKPGRAVIPPRERQLALLTRYRLQQRQPQRPTACPAHVPPRSR